MTYITPWHGPVMSKSVQLLSNTQYQNMAQNPGKPVTEKKACQQIEAVKDHAHKTASGMQQA
jgi:hypothetical protein